MWRSSLTRDAAEHPQGSGRIPRHRAGILQATINFFQRDVRNQRPRPDPIDMHDLGAEPLGVSVGESTYRVLEL